MTSLVPCTASEASQMHTRGHEVNAFLFASLARSNLPPLGRLRITRTRTNVKREVGGWPPPKEHVLGCSQREGPFSKDTNPFPLEGRGGIKVALWMPPPPPHHLRGKHTIISCSGFAPTPTNGTSPYANETGIT